MNVKPLLATLLGASLLTGCVTTSGDHTYVNGQCVDCWQNPFGPQKEQPAPTGNRVVVTQQGFTRDEHPCGMRSDAFKGEVPNVDSGDPRWCSDYTLPDGQWSEWITLEKTYPYDVDVTYLKVKKGFDFLDPDDIARRQAAGQKYINNTGIDASYDAVPGKIYMVSGNFGGPTRKVDYLARYELEVARIATNQSQVRLKYRMYDDAQRDPAVWGDMMLDL